MVNLGLNCIGHLVLKSLQNGVLKKFLPACSLMIATTLFCKTIQAQFVFTPSISYMKQSYNDGTNPESDIKLTLLDFRLGYVMDFGLYIGGLYSIHDQDLIAPGSSDSYFGPSVGYFNSGFLGVLTYYIYGEKDFATGNSKLSNVGGFQLDFSYLLPITPTIYLGPQLTYHSIEFRENEVSGVAQSADFDFSSLTPYFNLLFMF